MIVVRDIFQLRFGTMREALALLKEEDAALRRLGVPPARVLSDVVGEYYTLVMETEYPNLGALETVLAAMSQDEGWRAFYGRFTPLVRHGRREVFRVMTL
jgi:hypothetical protein